MEFVSVLVRSIESSSSTSCGVLSLSWYLDLLRWQWERTRTHTNHTMCDNYLRCRRWVPQPQPDHLHEIQIHQEPNLSESRMKELNWNWTIKTAFVNGQRAMSKVNEMNRNCLPSPLLFLSYMVRLADDKGDWFIFFVRFSVSGNLLCSFIVEASTKVPL